MIPKQFAQPGDANRAKGRRAKASGSTFERALCGIHQIYRMERRALVDQCHSEIAGFGSTMRFACRAPIDFAGTLAGGRAVYIEAKATAPKGTLEIDTAYTVKHCKGIKFEQVEALRDRAAMGALCLIAWWNGERCGIFVVPPGWQPSGVSMSRKQFAWLEPGSYDWLSLRGTGGGL